MTKKMVAMNHTELLSGVHELCVNLSTREVYLHGETMDREANDIIDYRTSVRFIKNITYLNQLTTEAPIIIHQMSPGGHWPAGMAIFDAIKSSPSLTIMLVHGMAYSMGSITMQAATGRLMQPDSEFMVHFGWAGSYNTSLGAIEEARIEKQHNKRMLQIYAERCVDGEFFKRKRMVLSDVISYIDRRIKKSSDWYMNAEEAVYYGFADGVSGSTSHNQKIMKQVADNLVKKNKKGK